MIDVKIYNGTISDFMEIVHDLRDQGLVQGKDFDFEYVPSKWDSTGFSVLEDKHVKFMFYTEKYAPFFILKYT